MKWFYTLLMLIGRICLALVFFLAGLDKMINYDTNASFMAIKNIPAIPFFLVGAALAELIGSILVFIGYKTRWAAALLALFLIPTTLIIHDFWNTPDMQKMMEVMFAKNISIFGGLLYLIACGPGRFAIDRNCHHNAGNCQCPVCDCGTIKHLSNQPADRAR